MKSEPNFVGDITSFRVTLDGTEYEVPYKQGKVLLDCMLDAGLDPAFQCQDGHCGTCMVALETGEVTMRKNNVLSQRDLDLGYVLACQSIPLTDDIWVDCDA